LTLQRKEQEERKRIREVREIKETARERREKREKSNRHWKRRDEAKKIVALQNKIWEFKKDFEFKEESIN